MLYARIDALNLAIPLHSWSKLPVGDLRLLDGLTGSWISSIWRCWRPMRFWNHERVFILIKSITILQAGFIPVSGSSRSIFTPKLWLNFKKEIRSFTKWLSCIGTSVSFSEISLQQQPFVDYFGSLYLFYSFAVRCQYSTYRTYQEVIRRRLGFLRV